VTSPYNDLTAPQACARRAAHGGAVFGHRSFDLQV
jgi:hypothetical protein